MIREVFRTISAIGIGAGAGRTFDSYFPPGQADPAAWAILVVSGLAFIASYWSEVRRQWWMWRTPFMTLRPLQITRIMDLHEFLADEGEKNSPRYRLEGDRDDKSRPSVDVGDWVIVTGKQAERLKGGHYSFVQCRIRSATGATPV